MSAGIINSRKVAFYTGCYFNYYRPEVSEAALDILRHNGIEVVLPEQVCCGLPMMAKGNFQRAYKNIEQNVKTLSKLVADGYAIITLCPSCYLMIKRDYPLLVNIAQAKIVAENIFHISVYIMELFKRGMLKSNFKEIPQSLFYHIPCHMRVQNLGEVTISMLKLIPGITIKEVSDVCCGLGGAYGFEKRHYETSREIAAKLRSMILKNQTDRIITDCGGCGLQIETITGLKVNHPIMLLQEAYNLSNSTKEKLVETCIR